MHIIGTGYGTSATSGATIFDNLAKNVAIPFVEEAYMTGNSFALESQFVMQAELTPYMVSSRKTGIKSSFVIVIYSILPRAPVIKYVRYDFFIPSLDASMPVMMLADISLNAVTMVLVKTFPFKYLIKK